MDDSTYKYLLALIPSNEYLRKFQKEANTAIDKSKLLERAKEEDKLRREIFRLMLLYRFPGYEEEFELKRKEFQKYAPEIFQFAKKLRASNVFNVLGYVMELTLQNVVMLSLSGITDEARDEFAKYRKRVYAMWSEIQKIKVFGGAALVFHALLNHVALKHKRKKGHQTQMHRKEFVRRLIDLVKRETRKPYEDIFEQIEGLQTNWPEWERPLAFETIRDIYRRRTRKVRTRNKFA